jgi:hypothetical protein
MSYGYENRNEDGNEDDGSWFGVLLAGAVVGAMVMGLVWVGAWWLSSDDPEPKAEVVYRQPPEEEPPLEFTGASSVTSLEDRCHTVRDAQTAALRAAADSLDQWEIHIGAMNKLVVGAITLKQAWQFWNDTRSGAHKRLHDYAVAQRHHQQRIYRCPAPSAAERKATPALGPCHRAVAARARTLHRARIALGTWKQHVHHMDMLRSGEMTPEQANQLWLQSWREGDRELRAYREAARASRGMTC